MKKPCFIDRLCFFVLVVVGLLAGAKIYVAYSQPAPVPALVAPPTKVSFDLWYPNGKLTTNGGQIFKLYGSPVGVGPVSSWQLATNIPGNQTNVEAYIYTPDGHYFFAMSVSNIWGEVFFSNLVTLPWMGDSNGVLNLRGIR